MPKRDDPMFRETAMGRERAEVSAFKEWEQAAKVEGRGAYG